MNDIDTLLDLHQFYTADSLKKLQTKLSKLSNGIINDGVESRIAVLFSKEEIETLKKAAAILRSVKSKVEHAKEIKTREEQHYERRYSEARAAALALFDVYFPEPDSLKEKFIISVSMRIQSHIFSLHYLATELDKIDLNGINFWIKDMWQDAKEELIRKVIDLPRLQVQMPEKATIEAFRQRIDNEIRQKVMKEYASYLDKLDQAITVESSDNIAQLLVKKPRS